VHRRRIGVRIVLSTVYLMEVSDEFVLEFVWVSVVVGGAG